jgi:hypothetical protein
LPAARPYAPLARLADRPAAGARRNFLFDAFSRGNALPELSCHRLMRPLSPARCRLAEIDWS